MPVEEALDLNLSTGDAQRWTLELQDTITRALNARQGMDNRIAGYWERYNLTAPFTDKPFAEASNIRCPLALWIADALWVRFMRTIYGQVPYQRVSDEDLANAPEGLPIQIMLQHLSETDLKLRFQNGHLLLNAIVEGTGIGKLRRDEQTRRIRDRRPWYQRALLGDALIERDVVDRVGLAYDVIDMKDFVVGHPAIVEIDRQPWVAHRVWLTWDDIVQRQKDGRYKITRSDLDRIKPLGKSRRLTAAGTSLEQVKADADRAEDIAWPTPEEYETWEIEGRFYLKENEATETQWVILRDWPDRPLVSQKFPFWNGHRNYLAIRPKPNANRFYGKSIVGEIQPIQDEADIRLNQDLNAKTISVLGAFTAILPRSFKRDWERHKWSLLKPIFVDAPLDFRTLRGVIGDLRMVDPELDRLFALAERQSGVTDPQLGKPSEGAKTAHEIATVQSEGNIKFAEYIEQIQGPTGNTELGYQIIEHAYQLSMENPEFHDRLVRVCGEDPFEGVSLAQIRARWSITPTGNTQVANRELEARKALALFEMFKEDPFVIADPMHMWYLRQQVLEAAGKGREADKIIGTEEQVKRFREITLQQRAAAGDASAIVLLESDRGTQQAQPLGPNGEIPPEMMMPPMEEGVIQ